MYFSVVQMAYWVHTLFNTDYTHTHTHIHIHIHTRAKIGLKKSLLFITEALTLIWLGQGQFFAKQLRCFQWWSKIFGSHKYIDERKAENSCSMVVSFPSTGNRKVLSGYYAYVAGTIWKNTGLAVKLNLNGSFWAENTTITNCKLISWPTVVYVYVCVCVCVCVYIYIFTQSPGFTH